MRRIQTKCTGNYHAWMWPHEVDNHGNPPDDWPCVCGLLYPNGDPVTYKDMAKTENLTGRCPRCNVWIDDHPTSHCDWNWT